MKHLFIIWQAGYPVKERVLADLKEQFTVEHICEVRWNQEQFDYALCRFYGGGIGAKAERCGRGPFTAIVVEDPEPMMSYDVSDRHGAHWVNLRVKQNKYKYRSWASGGSGHVADCDYIHASDTDHDTKRDVMLLFGCDPETLPQGSWQWLHDLVGMPFYRTEQEVFEVLNAATEYVLLRIDEKDIDLLVANREKAVLEIGARPLFHDPLRTAHVVNVAGMYRQLDVRYIGDGYYDTNWQRAMLATRELRDGRYRLDAEHDFYALYYHALVHKQAMPYNRHLELTAMAQVHGFAYQRYALNKWMAQHGYRYTRPVDGSVYFNEHEVPMPTMGDQLRHSWRVIKHGLAASA